MKQANNRRSRSRGNGKRYPNQRGGVFESNGPEVKVRGTAHQVHEKYLVLARDANSAGDRISAEGYFQYAEHYFRVISADANAAQSGHGNQGNVDVKTRRTQADSAQKQLDSELSPEDNNPSAAKSTPVKDVPISEQVKVKNANQVASAKN